MSDKHGSILTTLAPIVFGLVIGGVGSYYLHSFNASPVSVAPASMAPAGGGGGRMGPGRGGMGAMMGGGGGFGGGQDPEHPFASERNKQALTDLIASLGSS